MDLPFGPRYNIGIDVGGTNTDGVLYDCVDKRIVASVKIPTEHASYAKAIDNSLKALTASIDDNGSEVASVNISTTVSTNALLEGKGEPSNLILIGFDRYPHIVSDIEGAIGPSSVLKVRGGHTGWGKERETFDPRAVENFAKDHRGELFTVSSMYSPRNPRHETAAKEILLANGSGHVTCSHELSYSRLNSVKRTVTAYLNTSLVPLAERLIDDIGSVAKKYGLSCPVMFLRSDSTLVPSEWCRRFPIEMIYSGPAASLRGACHIAGGESLDSFVAVDIGGTSTDIGRIYLGRAVFSDAGAKIGSYQTMIPSLNIMSIALGGDSRTEVCGTEDIRIGPERSVPLCMTAQDSGLQAETVIKDLLGCPDEAEGIGRSEADGSPKPLMTDDVPRTADLGKWMAMGYSYTPTDAFNTMELSEVGDPKISKAASYLKGKKAGTAGYDLAEAVAVKAHSMLESSISEYTSACGQLPRVYVGTPAKVFAKLGDNGEAEITVPRNFDVAGAVGAAVSSIELNCRVSIMHSFSDESFTAFLPETTISSENFQELLEMAEKAAGKYLAWLAGSMGYHEIIITAEKAISYAGEAETVSTLLSASIECRAVVKNAQ
ncbi:MAG TPA: hypothetical protein DCL58_09040 [Synergistaceae bacterium]|jgi:hypothetical protein|uniref:hydantoinase/oxoprolinase N-terminal domain-containing protein n=1 Tax=Synergistaceae TaxID=649777 RepID=UPI000ED6E17D|nr:hydantoinase/oxoprolinase family protein [Synergistaceae bacterium DZ-S4]HAH69910.1 hypothetical protein [Synergistaceae bacterium]